MAVTGSSNRAHGVCCKPDSTDFHCNDNPEHVCSPPSFDTSSSDFANVLDSNGRNHQLFAFCPQTTRSFCGISSESENSNMRLNATLSKKTLTGDLQYKQGRPAQRRHESCYYEIQIDDSEDLAAPGEKLYINF